MVTAGRRLWDDLHTSVARAVVGAEDPVRLVAISLLADGHHRYAMALRYRDEMRAEHGPGPWDRVMMFIADAAIQEPPVLPFHRIQTGGPHEATGTRVRDLAEVLETVSDERVLEHVDAELRFTPDAVEAEDAVRSREAVAAFFLPSTDAARIRDVIDRG